MQATISLVNVVKKSNNNTNSFRGSISAINLFGCLFLELLYLVEAAPPTPSNIPTLGKKSLTIISFNLKDTQNTTAA